MKPFNNYAETQSYSDFPTLPKGSYICKIMDARENISPSGWQHLAISLEITEGDYANYYMNRWNNDTRVDKKWGCVLNVGIPQDDGSEQDGWTKRRFKTIIEAIEDSNAGYHWDWNEKALKGKTVGGLFRMEQYLGNDGNVHETVRVASLCSVEKVNAGTYKIPKDKLLDPDKIPQSNVGAGFMDIPEGVEAEGLPFN